MYNGVAMQAFPNPAEPVQKRSPITPLAIVLGLVFAFFCAVLVFVYITTKRINPVMLDQHGVPLSSQPQPTTPASPHDAKAQQPEQPLAVH